ncbi:hypothetical protein [Nocardia sp. NPDC047654]|uniref:hypothetical protein n=1 Tax=Nocardia sp. NPDC047654 TaxID=3364314 RepID=UPI00371F4BAE
MEDAVNDDRMRTPLTFTVGHDYPAPYPVNSCAVTVAMRPPIAFTAERKLGLPLGGNGIDQTIEPSPASIECTVVPSVGMRSLASMMPS